MERDLTNLHSVESGTIRTSKSGLPLFCRHQHASLIGMGKIGSWTNGNLRRTSALMARCCFKLTQRFTSNPKAASGP